jgi:mannosyltransferase
MATQTPAAVAERDPLPGGLLAGGVPGPGRERLVEIAVVAVPCVLAALLSFYAITARSLWLDEAASVAIASQHGIALWHAMEHDGGNMVAYYALLHGLTGLLGHSLLVIRFCSAAAAVATVAIVCLLARRLFDDRVAFAAGLLTAVSLPLVYWAQDARSYALMIALIAGSFLSFVALVDREPGTRTPRSVWLAYVLTTVLAAYMSFEAVLIVPAQLLSLAWARRSIRPVLSALVTAGACCLPLLVLAERRGSSQLFWVPKPNLVQLHYMGEALLSAGFEPNFHPTSTGAPLLWLTVAFLLFAAGLAILGPWLHRARGHGAASLNGGGRRPANGRRASWPEVLVLCWLLVPVALSLLESVTVQPITLPRAVLVSLPAVSILLAWAAMHSRVPGWLGWSCVGIVVVLRALQLAPSYGTSPENWKAATAHVLAVYRPGDCIAFYPSDGRQAFQYYIGSSAAPRSVLPAVRWNVVKPYVEQYVSPAGSSLARIEAGCPRLWFVSSHSGQKHGPPASRLDYARWAALKSSLSSAYAHHHTVAYGWASPVRVELFGR